LFVRYIDLSIRHLDICVPVLAFDDKSKKIPLASETPEMNGSLIKALIPLEPCVGQSFAKDSNFVKTMSGRTFI